MVARYYFLPLALLLFRVNVTDFWGKTLQLLGLSENHPKNNPENNPKLQRY